jgi:putative hydrolase of the HAD superfamily
MPAMVASIRWVLFDADGVLQQMPADWQEPFEKLLQPDPLGTLQELFELERPTMTGGDFTAVVAGVLDRRGIDADPEEVLQGWRSLVVDPDMLGRVADLRATGIGCALATNQQNVRVAYMRTLNAYVDAFEAQFYSSELGLAKPDLAYFTAIVERLRIEPGEALFLDDREDNVAGAREAGLAAEVFAENAGLPELDRILGRYGIDLRAAT